MTKRTANVNASCYDGKLDIGFDCPGVQFCRFALCPMMPPDENTECTFKHFGSCLSPSSQRSIVKNLRDKLTDWLRESDEYDEEA